MSLSSESDKEEFAQTATLSKESKIVWSKSGKTGPPKNFILKSGPSQAAFDLEDPTPYDVCKLLISESLIKLITFQTNLYAQQLGKQFIPTDENEIRTFIGINLLMGIKKLPNYRDYWSTSYDLHDFYISSLMSVNCFGWLLNNLHLNGNAVMPSRDSSDYHDRLNKLQTFSLR
jgi:hypothetical protein